MSAYFLNFLKIKMCHLKKKCTSWELCFIPQTFWGLQTQDTAPQVMLRKLLQRGKARELEYIGYCSVAQSCPTLCHSMDCSAPGLPVLHYLSKSAQTHVHWVGDAIQPSPPLSSPSPPVLYLSQHQRLFQWVGASQQVAKLLEYQFFQWISELISFRNNWFDLQVFATED